MGESREGEGRSAEGVTTTVISSMVDDFANEGLDFERISVLRLTDGTYQVTLHIRGQAVPEVPIYVGVDEDLFNRRS